MRIGTLWQINAYPKSSPPITHPVIYVPSNTPSPLTVLPSNSYPSNLTQWKEKQKQATVLLAFLLITKYCKCLLIIELSIKQKVKTYVEKIGNFYQGIKVRTNSTRFISGVVYTGEI